MNVKTINEREFTEYKLYGHNQHSGWTVYVDEYSTPNGTKYYVGQTKRRVSMRHADANKTEQFSWSGKKYQYSAIITELRKRNCLARTWLYTGIETEEEARRIETETIRALNAEDPKQVLNTRDEDPPIHAVKATSHQTGITTYFPSIKAAMKTLGITSGASIRKAIRGQYKQAYGYIWANA